MSGYFAVSVHLVFTHGALPGGKLTEEALGEMAVSLWLNAYEMGSDVGVHGVITEKNEDEAGFSTHRCHPDADELERFVVAVKEAGFEGSAPDVSDLGDTSEKWSRLLLHISLNDKSSFLDLGFQGSSYDGPDAEGLSRVLGLLLGLTRVSHSQAWAMLVRSE